MTVMAAETTTEFSVAPFAHADPDDDQAHALLEALIADRRALGAWSISTDSGQVSTVFQVAVPDGGDVADATGVAVAVFDRALAAAGIAARTAGVSVVEGDDPDQLP